MTPVSTALRPTGAAAAGPVQAPDADRCGRGAAELQAAERAGWRRRRARRGKRARAPAREQPHSSSSVSISSQLGSREPSVAAEGPQVAGLHRIAERAGDDLAVGIAGDRGDVGLEADRDRRRRRARASLRRSPPGRSSTSRLSSVSPSLLALLDRSPRMPRRHGRRHGGGARPDRPSKRLRGSSDRPTWRLRGSGRRRSSGRRRGSRERRARRSARTPGRRSRPAAGCGDGGLGRPAAPPARRSRPASGSAAAHGPVRSPSTL